MYKELKKTIINWLLENENEFNRLTRCKEYFRQYIYNNEGEYIIGGLNTARFIEKTDKLLYGGAEYE